MSEIQTDMEGLLDDDYDFEAVLKALEEDPEWPKPQWLVDLVKDLQHADAWMASVLDWWEDWREKPPPEGGSETEGFMGLILFTLNHPDDVARYVKFPKVIKELLAALLKTIGSLLPNSKIKPKQFHEVFVKKVNEGTATAYGGEIYGFKTYENADVGWLVSLFNGDFVRRARHPLSWNTLVPEADFGNRPSHVILPDKCRVGIIGDWGVGDVTRRDHKKPGLKVIESIVSKEIDFLIHLGDTYYSGCPSSNDMKIPKFWNAGEEAIRLLAHWPNANVIKPSHSFTLNSNHEMYCGGLGYFKALEKDLEFGGKTFKSPFKHQKGTSYFLLENEQVQIFGLDCAYYTQDWLADGARFEGDDKDEKTQTKWLRNHFNNSKTTIALTHHNPVKTGGKPRALLGKLKAALGGKLPSYWYFGHAHNGIVYEDAVMDGCKGRCIGHSGVPMGFPRNLVRHADVKDVEPGRIPDKYTPMPGIKWVEGDRATDGFEIVKSGYAVLDINGAHVAEEVYDEDGILKWSSESGGR
ncbi:MAG: metallophosphoesterase [Pseudomonadota bacterium]